MLLAKPSVTMKIGLEFNSHSVAYQYIKHEHTGTQVDITLHTQLHY